MTREMQNYIKVLELVKNDELYDMAIFEKRLGKPVSYIRILSKHCSDVLAKCNTVAELEVVYQGYVTEYYRNSYDRYGYIEEVCDIYLKCMAKLCGFGD